MGTRRSRYGRVVVTPHPPTTRAEIRRSSSGSRGGAAPGLRPSTSPSRPPGRDRGATAAREKNVTREGESGALDRFSVSVQRAACSLQLAGAPTTSERIANCELRIASKEQRIALPPQPLHPHRLPSDPFRHEVLGRRTVDDHPRGEAGHGGGGLDPEATLSRQPIEAGHLGVP